jgi:hypothetical protein
MASTAEVLARLSSLDAAAAGEEGALQQADGALAALVAKAKADLSAALLELAAVFLPTLSAETLTDAEEATGCRRFRKLRPLDVMAKEERQLQARIEQLRADERYRRREALIGPHGERTRALAEAEDHLATWEADAARFEGQDGFLELVELGYDTPAFATRWWEPAYWRAWARGDAICAALQLADFGDDVLPAYHKVRAPRDQWREEVARLRAERDAVRDLVRQHDEAALRLQHLAAHYLDEARQTLADHLRHADAALIAEWNPDERGVQVLLRTITGLSAKLDGYAELRGTVEREVGALRQRRQQWSEKRAKLSRPKKAYLQHPETELRQAEDERLARVAAQRAAVLREAEKADRFSRYGEVKLSTPRELWWSAFTGRPPGKATPNLQRWTARNPSRQVEWEGGGIGGLVRDVAVATVVGTAVHHVVDRSLDHLGDLS